MNIKTEKVSKFFAVALLLSVLNSCSDDDVALQDEVNDFVWLAMNQFYFWQSGVPELDDNIASSRNSLNQFLNQYTSPESLFSDLLHPEDRNRQSNQPFSWIVDDYEELEASFQGVSTSFGYEFRLVNPTGTDWVYGFVKYVVPGSPAALAGIERGDLFTEVDGSMLTLDNYSSLLFGQTSYSLTFGELVGDDVVSTDETVSISAVQLTENPIHLSKTIDLGGVRVGYLAYNQFVNSQSAHQELNAVFGDFLSEGISELVLDLRYNLGGSISTTQLLASMIYGNAGESTVFGSLVYNEKLTEIFSDSDLNFYFQTRLESGEALNRLNINRLFVLTSGSTASASELIIAGLTPYMDVTLIGTTTVGKNVGSVTLYDSPEEAYLDRGADLNRNHRYAIQPIISQLANSEGFTDYIDGFDPNIEIDELDLIGEIAPLGDVDEHLLAEALSIIGGASRRSIPEQKFWLRAIDDSHRLKKHIQTIKLDLGVVNLD